MYMKLNNNLLNIKNTHSTSETDVYSANQTNVEIANAVKDVYSTSEVKTNKIASNGKPIYRLEIDNIAMTIGAGVVVPTGITNMDTLEDLKTHIKTSSQDFINNQFYSTSIFFSANFDRTQNNNVLYDLSGNALKGTLKVTIEYTKSS